VEHVEQKMAHPVQDLIKELDTTQAAVAQEIGITRQYLSNIINGKRASSRVAALLVKWAEEHAPGRLSLEQVLYPKGLPPLEILREGAR